MSEKMIYFRTVIRRETFGWFSSDGLKKESIGKYIRELERQKRALKEQRFDTEKILGIDSKKFDELESILEEEIKYGKFYLNYFKKQNEKDFNEWVFVENDKEHEYDSVHNSWTKSNGKIKMIIRIENKVPSTRVSLKIKNDDNSLTFYEGGYGSKEICYTNLRKKESVDEEIERLKKLAEEYFMKYQYPQYCPETRQIEILEQLLHIEK